jgi:hypothetical protein
MTSDSVAANLSYNVGIFHMVTQVQCDYHLPDTCYFSSALV